MFAGRGILEPRGAGVLLGRSTQGRSGVPVPAQQRRVCVHVARPVQDRRRICPHQQQPAPPAVAALRQGGQRQGCHLSQQSGGRCDLIFNLSQDSMDGQAH